MFCYFFSCVDVPFSGSYSSPPQGCLPSERPKTAESAAPMDAQANSEVETKRTPEDTSPAQQHTQMVQFQPTELSEQEAIFSRNRKT